jgi:hypothetical protein
MSIECTPFFRTNGFKLLKTLVVEESKEENESAMEENSSERPMKSKKFREGMKTGKKIKNLRHLRYMTHLTHLAPIRYELKFG